MSKTTFIPTHASFLTPIYTNVKSFYEKARIESDNNNNFRLISYNTVVVEIINNEIKIYGEFSKTTMTHIREFIKQFYPGVNTDLKTIREIISNS